MLWKWECVLQINIANMSYFKHIVSGVNAESHDLFCSYLAIANVSKMNPILINVEGANCRTHTACDDA